MARKTKQEAQETRQHILDVALRLFSQQGVSSTSLGEIAKAAGVTRGAIYWHFKDKSDLFSEIWELSESNIGELELEYQAKFPGDPLSVLRVNRPGFPGECFICELRLPDHRFRWKHNKLFLLLPEEYGPAFPA
ncbi:TetR family transcriptional regulator, partial [Escherichia coli]